MNSTHPAGKTNSAHYHALLWQLQRHIALLPDERVGRIVSLLNMEEVGLLAGDASDRMRGLLAHFLDDAALLQLADDREHPHSPEGLALLVGVRDTIRSLGWEPPVENEELERRNLRLSTRLKERLDALGVPGQKALRDQAQREHYDDNRAAAEKLLTTLPLLETRTLRALVAGLSELDRLFLTRWADDIVKGLVYQFLSAREIVDLEEYPLGPTWGAEMYACLARIQAKLSALNPVPATGPALERLLRRNSRVARRVVRDRERTLRRQERESFRELFPAETDLEPMPRWRVLKKILDISLQSRKHAVRTDDGEPPAPVVNRWLSAAVNRERNPLFRWGLKSLLGEERPPADRKARSRELKLRILAEFCRCTKSGAVLSYAEMCALLNTPGDERTWEVPVGELQHEAFDSYSRDELEDKLCYWSELAQERGDIALEEEGSREENRLLKVVLELLTYGISPLEWFPMLEEAFARQRTDKRETIIFLMGSLAKGRLTNPYWLEGWGQFCFQLRRRGSGGSEPPVTSFALARCGRRDSPMRHIFPQGGIDTLTELQTARKVISFANGFRRVGPDFLRKVIDRETSSFFLSCWRVLLAACEHFGERSWDKVVETFARELVAIGELYQARLAENCRVLAELLPYLGCERFDALLEEYGSPEPGALPDRRSTLEDFTGTEVAARAAAYHRLCRRPSSPLSLVLAPLDLNRPPWTPIDLERIPIVKYLLTLRADGLDPDEIRSLALAALPIIERRERAKIRKVIWGLDATFLRGYSSALLERVYQYCLEG